MKASGLNSRPSCELKRKDRHERDGDDQEAEEQGGADFGGGADQDRDSRLTRSRPLQVLVCVLDHDDGSINHRANCDRNAAEAHDVGADAEQLHRAERHQDADRQHQDGDERAADVQQEDDADESDDDTLLKQRVPERVNGGIDQVRPVVDGNDLDRFRQAGLDLPESSLDALDDIESVHAKALQHDAACDFSVAVELGDTTPFVGTEFDARHVAQQDRRTALCLEHDVAEIVDALQVALAADHVLKFRQFDGAAADVGVARADGIAHLLHRDAEIAHPLRIEDHVVLLDEAADTGDFGDALRPGERELEIPVLDRSRVGEVQLLRHHCILVYPADACRVGTDRRRHPGRQSGGRAIEEFEDPRTRPIDVGAVFKDNVDKGDAEKGEAAYHLRFRDGQHRGGQRIGDLILDDLRGLPRVLRVNDDLGI